MQLGFTCIFSPPQPQLPTWNRCPKNLFRKLKLPKLQLLPHEFSDARFPSSSQRLEHLFTRHLYDVLPQCAEISRVITLNLAEVPNKLHPKKPKQNQNPKPTVLLITQKILRNWEFVLSATIQGQTFRFSREVALLFQADCRSHCLRT